MAQGQQEANHQWNLIWDLLLGPADDEGKDEESKPDQLEGKN